jgi:hypothetical protein
MSDIIRELPNTVSDEAWLEFVAERGTSEVYATPLETRADAARLRASAMRRAVMLRQQMHAGCSPAVAELAQDHP